MSNFLEYKGFKAKLDFSPDDEIFFGRLVGIDDVVTFEGKTVAKLKKSFKEAVDFHIEVCKKTGEKLKKTYSGKVFLRVSPYLHSQIAETAEAKGQSINEWSKEVLEEAMG